MEEAQVATTARAWRRVARVIEGSSRGVEKLCHRLFYPNTLTRAFDWPYRPGSASWRLWFDGPELVSATSVTSAGSTISSSDYLLRPDDGPPYNRLEIDLSGSASLGGGDTHQRDVGITGVWGYRNDEDTAGTLAAAVSTTTATTLDTDGDPDIGVGSVLRVNSERVIVTERAMLDTSVTIDAADSLTASKADVAITLSTLTHAPQVGETILIDSERMRVVELAGSVITVERAYDGTVLAAHAALTAIYAPRRLTITRGALGTTAATHSSGDDIYVWQPPPLVRQLSIAESVAALQQGPAAYSGTRSAGDSSTGAKKTTPGAGLNALRAQVYAAYGRKARSRAV
jgi:hypothetical protein